jgi:hypothetical protein
MGIKPLIVIDQEEIFDEIITLPEDSDQIYLQDIFYGTEQKGFWATGLALIGKSLYQFDFREIEGIEPTTIELLFTLPDNCLHCETPLPPFKPKCYFDKFQSSGCSACCHYATCFTIVLVRRDPFTFK